MIPRYSATFTTIAAAATLALGITSTAAAQVPGDTAAASRDTTTAVSQQRIPVTKEQGAYDTTTSTGAIANPHDTTSTRSVDTTTAYPDSINRDRTTMMDSTAGAATDTTGVVTDTSAGSVTTGVSSDTTTRQGITGINDTTVNVDTTTMPSDTSVIRSDTTTAGAVMPSTTEADTIGLYPSSGRMGGTRGGFYVGVGGGASVPIGNLHDGGYDTGWNITVPIGWQSSTTPWGLRLDLSYNRLNGGTLASAPVNVTVSDANLWSGALDLTLQFPFGSSGSSFYLMGGGGIHHFTDVGNDNGAAVIDGTSLASSANGSLTKAGVNGGAGFNFGFGRAKLFLESRFVSVFTEGKNSNYVPIILGVRVF